MTSHCARPFTSLRPGWRMTPPSQLKTMDKVLPCERGLGPHRKKRNFTSGRAHYS